MIIIFDFQIMVMVLVGSYYGGAMWWRCQSPSKAHEDKLEVNIFDRSVSVSPHHRECCVCV